MADAAKHVFISYVHEDSPRVDELCKVLTAAQIPYWRDRKDLGPGDAWKQKIRNAIQSGSLVFLACFSEQSVAKAKSYMNEELTLAAEELRLRAPGRPWLIPLRLDSVEMPQWDLGAGRTLDDFNRVDLFGDDYATQAVLLATAIHRLMGDAAPDEATTAASVQSASDRERPERLRRATKEMLPDPSRRIAQDDLISGEMTRVLSAMRNETYFPTRLTATEGSEAITEVVRTAQSYWSLIAPFCWSLQVAARWGEPSALAPWSTALRRLGTEAAQVKSGHTMLITLRNLPLLATVFTAALAAASQERWHNLRTLLVDVTVATPRGPRAVPLVRATDPYEPFTDFEMVPHALARAAIEHEDPGEALAAFGDGRATKYRTPVSEWLHHILKPVFAEQLPDDPIYDTQFDQAEILLGLLEQDFVNTTRSEDSLWVGGAHWFGRSTWRSRYSSGNSLETLSDQLKHQGNAWGPLTAGLFGGSQDRVRVAIEDYRGLFEKISASRW
ncbi:toll/interleukin-1 receptor domain-containing protein [Promicromonospora sp. CA-289599]|uniref:toll/interleukin-1 receptor domain-containing protein n=1 Tax=Promicromonospora sp. CA-289599 TaxID=3240014 RepID=UPI003D8B8DFE